jgi:hypothetical protein
LVFWLVPNAWAANSLTKPDFQTNGSIPWDQIGAKAGAGYTGDSLGVIATSGGARLHCAFQRLDAEATDEGLWLTSSVTNQAADRFRLTAVAMGHASLRTNSQTGWPNHQTQVTKLPVNGTVSVEGQTVRFTRPGLVEEYSVGIDGVRQDFLVSEKPAGSGELRLQLAVSGARVEQTAYGAQLMLPQSGRKIAYSRLHVTDARGKELPAKIEVAALGSSPCDDLAGTPQGAALRTPHSAFEMAVVVDDTDAVYPVRIDPTFSDANWISMNTSTPGTDIGFVWAAAGDGSGNFYIGGDFTSVCGITVNHIAQWNGSSWSALGSGMNGAVYALAASGSTVYAGGTFTTAGGVVVNRIAKWNGSSWSALGSGMDSDVVALALSGSDVYAGGVFFTAGGVPASRIAKWNGSSWSPLGSGANNYVLTLAVSGSNVYAGGTFTFAGDVPANRIAVWNGSSWSALGSGMDNQVNALLVSGSNLYVGGNFSTAGDVAANYVAKWDGNTWSALGSGMNDRVDALAMSGTDLYAGGNFTTADGMTANYIAKWNGSSWSALDSGMNQRVETVVASGSFVYAGGNFTTAGGVAANYIAQWNGSSWSGVGSVLGNTVRALAVSGIAVYAGGDFTTAGGVAANHIAQWNGSSWSALGSGLNGYVDALAVTGSNVYAGGNFTTAGGVAANDVAKWNGSSWSTLGSGMNNPVVALAVSGNNVYAGGGFTTAGGVTANHIAQWNGSSWSALGSGVNNGVSALAVSGSDVYAGGNFTTAGGVAANSIAKWNGTSWSPLGSGMNNPVIALAVSGSNVYAGGGFTTAGGVSANSIAKWDGNSWSALGSGVNNEISALAVSGSDVYAGGNFTTAGGAAANAIAKWDGNSWSPLGSGINGPVYALAASGSDLFAGGNFTTAGGTFSAYAAEAIISPGLMLQFDFEDTGTTTTDSVAGVSLQLVDSSGAPVDLHGIPGSGVGGYGQSLNFTPATMGGSGPMAFTTNNFTESFGTLDAFTVTLWIKPASSLLINAYPRFFTLGANGLADRGVLNSLQLLSDGNGQPGTAVQGFVNTLQTDTGAFGAFDMSSNQWSFLALTYDVATLKFYGGSETNPVSLQSSAPFAAGTVTLANAWTLMLGNRLALDRAFAGQMDAVRFYSDALPLSAIESIRAAAVALPAIAARQSGSNLVLTLHTRTNALYILQSTTNLALPAWTPVFTNAGLGTVISNSVPINPAAPQQFYRYQIR